MSLERAFPLTRAALRSMAATAMIVTCRCGGSLVVMTAGAVSPAQSVQPCMAENGQQAIVRDKQKADKLHVFTRYPRSQVPNPGDPTHQAVPR
jgi:hypothetical protein